jgi:hypothetical protein
MRTPAENREPPLTVNPEFFAPFADNFRPGEHNEKGTLQPSLDFRLQNQVLNRNTHPPTFSFPILKPLFLI